MKALRSLYGVAVAAMVALLLMVVPVLAQQQKRTSPHDVTGAVLDGNRVTVYYGRPYMKDPKTGETRKIWGGVVPYGKVWRLGANEATLLLTQKDITIGTATVPAGAYSLFLLPKEDGSATLIINKQIGQWGTQHDEAQDLARVELTAETLAEPVEQFTMTIVKATETAPASLKLMWENRAFSAPITVVK